MEPIINEPDDDLSAALTAIFWQGCWNYLDGDSCSVNRRLAIKMQVPLVGCASHRLNRAVHHHSCSMKRISDVQALMSQLRIMKQSAKRRFKATSTNNSPGHSLGAHLRHGPPLLCAARISGRGGRRHHGLAALSACNRRLKKLHVELKDIESVSKALQAEDVSLLDARVWFDDLIAAHPTFVIYIGEFIPLVFCFYQVY
ncbi:hypothetical protein GQ600_21421 [Phytophthora cactorum]|nr:hypothetical protein GQ600_21421 [Phytophthora cactorum]